MSDFGINVAFPPKRVDISEYYERIFRLMCEQGVTICRIWLSDFSFNYYNYRNSQHELNLGELAKIVSMASLYNVKFIPVLFDFNEFSTSNVHWSNYEHTFHTSYISRYLKRPIEFFLEEYFELGLSKLSALKAIFNEDRVYAWELFNEVDLMKDYEVHTVARWVTNYSSEITKCSSKPIYLSFSNPKYIDEALQFVTNVKLALHIYQWPYRQTYKNLVFWQKKYPSLWIMECGSPRASSQDIIVALIASFVLNNRKQVAMPWFWEHILALRIYEDLNSILMVINRHIEEGEQFHFSGELGTNNRGIDVGAIRNHLKLSAVGSLLFKAAVTLKTMTSRASRLCFLTFTSDRMVITIETQFAPSASIDHDRFSLLDSCSVPGITVNLYNRL